MVNHKQLINMIAGRQSQITDENFFSSNLLMAHLWDITRAVTKRYSRTDNIKINLYWDERDDSVACTNNREIIINTANPLLKGTDREERYHRILGFLSHEIGHCFYTDFRTGENFRNVIRTGVWYPFAPDSKYDSISEEVLEFFKSQYGSVLISIALQLSNIMEDGYIEDRMLRTFPGSLGYGLEKARAAHWEEIEPLEVMLVNEQIGNRHPLATLEQLILEYVKFGELKYAPELKDHERIHRIYSIIPLLDQMLDEDDSKKRFGFVNSLVCELWSEIKDYLDYCEKKAQEQGNSTEEQNNAAQKGIQGQSQRGSGNSPQICREQDDEKSSSTTTTKRRQMTRQKATEAEEDKKSSTSKNASSDESPESKVKQDSKSASSSLNEDNSKSNTESAKNDEKEDNTENADGSETEQKKEDSGNTNGEDSDDSDGDSNSETSDADEKNNQSAEDDTASDSNDANDENDGSDLSDKTTEDDDDTESDAGSHENVNEEDTTEADIPDDNDDSENDSDTSDHQDCDEDGDADSDLSEDERDDNGDADREDEEGDTENIFNSEQDSSDNDSRRNQSSSLDERNGNADIEYDNDYSADIKERAADEISKLLKKMAEQDVTSELETQRSKELTSFAKSLNYGNIHRGVPIRVHRQGAVSETAISQYNAISPDLLQISKLLQKSVLQKLKDYERGGKLSSLPLGRRMDSRNLYRPDGRFFYKTNLPQNPPDMAVGVVIDESGSMRWQDRAVYARAAAIILYDFCHSLNIPIAIYGQSTDRNFANQGVEIYSYAEFDSIDLNDKYRLMDIRPRSNSRDSVPVRFVAERLLKRPESEKILIVFSDGQPEAFGYSGKPAYDDLSATAKEYIRKKIHIIAAAIGDDKPAIENIYGDAFMNISNLKDIPKLLTDRIKKFLPVR